MQFTNGKIKGDLILKEEIRILDFQNEKARGGTGRKARLQASSILGLHSDKV